VRDGVIVDLNGRLVIFRDEDGFVVADYLADPNVVIIVSVFHDLRGGPTCSTESHSCCATVVRRLRWSHVYSSRFVELDLLIRLPSASYIW